MPCLLYRLVIRDEVLPLFNGRLLFPAPGGPPPRAMDCLVSPLKPSSKESKWDRVLPYMGPVALHPLDQFPQPFTGFARDGLLGQEVAEKLKVDTELFVWRHGGPPHSG